MSVVGRAVGILMALVPCDSRCARRILAEPASAADVCLQEAAWAAVAVLRGDPPLPNS
ncbi:hypothetical protein OG756_05045 [Streptomyces sp. NBC_01310]|uniref:hypothetical protein n=1 Tax=Streptomyces sp. NBC_01310 TaxID=2903820 RepID=UPI0035B6847C|nr:hypothetical protein OG756_05045 [Streptomyces sp. NBC_01310]